MLARAGRLDGGVERQHPGLLGDAPGLDQEALDLLRRPRQRLRLGRAQLDLARQPLQGRGALAQALAMGTGQSREGRIPIHRFERGGGHILGDGEDAAGIVGHAANQPGLGDGPVGQFGGGARHFFRGTGHLPGRIRDLLGQGGRLLGRLLDSPHQPAELSHHVPEGLGHRPPANRPNLHFADPQVSLGDASRHRFGRAQRPDDVASEPTLRRDREEEGDEGEDAGLQPQGPGVSRNQDDPHGAGEEHHRGPGGRLEGSRQRMARRHGRILSCRPGRSYGSGKPGPLQSRGGDEGSGRNRPYQRGKRPVTVDPPRFHHPALEEHVVVLVLGIEVDVHLGPFDAALHAAPKLAAADLGSGPLGRALDQAQLPGPPELRLVHYLEPDDPLNPYCRAPVFRDRGVAELPSLELTFLRRRCGAPGHQGGAR